MSIELKQKYQAFNMSNDYRAPITCPFGCTAKLVEEQLLLHVTKCWKQDDSIFGHCKYNYLHIYPYSQLPFHEQNCTSNIPMSEEDFAYKPDPTYNNINLDWAQDELSLKYAKYFVPFQDQDSKSQQEEPNKFQSQQQDSEKQTQECDQQQNQIVSDGETEKDFYENEQKTQDQKKENFTEFQLQINQLKNSNNNIILGNIENENQNKSQVDDIQKQEKEKQISEYLLQQCN